LGRRTGAIITTAVFAATGSTAMRSSTPIVVPAVCFVLGVLLMPETRKISIWQPASTRAADNPAGDDAKGRGGKLEPFPFR